MAVTATDVFSILTGGYFSTTEVTGGGTATPIKNASQFQRWLIQTCSITRYTKGDLDGFGRPTETETTTDNVRTRLDQEVQRYIQDGKVLNVKTMIAFFEMDVDVRLRDTITIGSRTYEVIDVDEVLDGNNIPHHYEVTLDRMVT